MTETRIPVTNGHAAATASGAATATATATPVAPEAGPVVIPPVDVVETPDAFVFRFDLPGVRREDVTLHLEDDLLRLDAEVPADAAAPGDVLYHEVEIARYRREFRLAEAIDADAARADLRHGVLTLTLLRRRQRVVIPIHVGDAPEPEA